jgi:PPM family protein phosphatase
LGGEALVPEMSLSRRQPLQSGDILLVCTDGLWANLDDASIAAAFAAPDTILFEALKRLSERAVAHGGAGSDNTSSAVLRFLE